MRIPARRIAPGQGEGRALVLRSPFSFVGGVDPVQGTLLDGASLGRGEPLSRRVLAFPTGKGSTVGCYILYGLAKRGLAPAALINERAEVIVAVGAILAGIPMVDRVDLGALEDGDRVIVRADGGEVLLPEVTERPVVSAFLRNRGRFLILRRSERVGTFQGRWSAVSGYLEGDEDPRERAVQEIREETGVRNPRFLAAGEPVVARRGAIAFVVHPFLFDVPSRRVALDWENVEYRWVRAEELDHLATVPRLKDVLLSALRGLKPRGA